GTPRFRFFVAGLEVVAPTQAVEECAVVVGILRLAAAVEQEVVLDHAGDAGAVVHPVLDANFRTGHEGIVHPVAIDATEAGANEGTGIAGAEVVVIEHPGRALELGALAFGVEDVDVLPDTPE